MRKIWTRANGLIAEAKHDWPNLVTRDEKLALINELEKLADHNGVGFLVDGFLEDLKSKVEAA